MRTIRPNVTLNSDTRQTLLDQMTDARNALLDAVKVMKAALPHARNYQADWREAYREDRDEAVRRIALAQDLAELYYQDAIALVEED
jgi:succinate dehydrogenase/fumarate reductase flavoprotein subunit